MKQTDFINLTPVALYPRERRTRFVYFMKAETTGLIKIGISFDPENRRRALESSEPLVLLAYMSGTVETERELHTRFSKLRAHGEWYNPGTELLAYVNEVKNAQMS